LPDDLEPVRQPASHAGPPINEAVARAYQTLAKVLGHSSIRTTVDLYADLATEDVAADLAREIAARETRLRNQCSANRHG
jgi:hypothetical protein